MSTLLREPGNQTRQLKAKDQIQLSEAELPARTSSFLPSFIDKHLNLNPARPTGPVSVMNDALMRIAAIKLLSDENSAVSFKDSDIRKEKQLVLRSGLGRYEQKLFLKIARAIAKYGDETVQSRYFDPVHAKAVSAASLYVRHVRNRIGIHKEQTMREDRAAAVQWRSFSN